MAIDLESIDLDNLKGVSLAPPTFVKYTEYEDGEVLVAGIYRGEFPNKFNPDKPNHKFELKGKKQVVLPSAGPLDYLMGQGIKIGDLVRVTFLGKEELTTGTYKGKSVNKFNVELLMEGDQEKAPAPETPTPETPKPEATEAATLDNLE